MSVLMLRTSSLVGSSSPSAADEGELSQPSPCRGGLAYLPSARRVLLLAIGDEQRLQGAALLPSRRGGSRAAGEPWLDHESSHVGRVLRAAANWRQASHHGGCQKFSRAEE